MTFGAQNMATMNVGFVSAAGIFLPELSRKEREDVLRPFEATDETGELCLKDELTERYASLCDLGLKRVLREVAPTLKTLRMEVGYSWVEHHKDWLRLGCELMVEKEEMDEAIEFLSDPGVTPRLERRLRDATKEFLAVIQLPIFEEVSCAYYINEVPGRDS